ncbi:MAG TPA: trimethylamine methyltransferase family protein [Thermoleophilia bacterium]
MSTETVTAVRGLRPRLSMLGAADMEYVHGQSLKLLAEVGVRFGSERALAALRAAGARIDEDTGIARLPRDLVESGIARAPKSVLLAARDPAKDALLDHTSSWATHDGMGAMTLDHRSGERRPSTARDLVQAMTLADALDEIGVLWYTVCPCDEMPRLQALRGLQAMLAGSAKHVQGAVVDPLEVPYAMEIVAAASDDGLWRPERPIFSIIYCPVSPLQHDRDSLEAAMLLAELSVPIGIYSLAMAGATAPVTLAGTIVQTNAEILATISLLQLTAPGCPLIYVANAAIMDMRSSSYVSAGPEVILLNLALTELGRFYGLPVLSCGLSTEAKELSVQGGAEGAPTALCSMLAGADLLTGAGMLDSAQLLYLPKLVLDAEIIAQGRRLLQGLVLDDEHVMLDVLARVGPGGHFLGERETRRFLHEGEHMLPRLFTRSPYAAWAAAGQHELERAAATVDEILATHRPLPLPPGADEKIEQVIAAARRELPADLRDSRQVVDEPADAGSGQHISEVLDVPISSADKFREQTSRR